MKRQKLPLVLEQLEDRIFLDANPLVVVDGAHDHVEEPTVDGPYVASHVMLRVLDVYSSFLKKGF